MIRSIARLWWFGLLGLAWASMSAESQAWDNPFVKVSNVRINFHVEMSTTPKCPPPTAPWYAYFPADPRLMASPQMSPYPPWPLQFPPAANPPLRSGSAAVPQGPMLTQYWPNHYAYGSNVQPVGYAPARAGYWYQGR